MAKVKIKTLTPVHIGSGRHLLKNTEFLIQGDKVGVVDEKKVVKIIGIENIDKWVNIINKGDSLLDYLKRRKRDVTLEDVSNRIMTVYGSDVSNKQSLKEQLHNAKLLPMIPGSSIKGAIRTAVITKLVNDNTPRVKKIINNKKGFFIKINPNWSWNLRDFQQTETAILNELLSGTFKMDANKNTFRFLQVSDFVFGDNTGDNTLANNMQVMNFYGNEWKFKQGSDQLTEMIGADCDAEGRILIKDEFLLANKNRREIKAETNFLSSLKELFKIINNHTITLLESEISLWEEDENSKDDVLDNYIENLKGLLDKSNNISENEAIIRIGGGSGWDSITGAWIKTNTDLLDNDEFDTLVNLLNKRRDVEYFPKTRKIDEDGNMLGFVKISLVI